MKLAVIDLGCGNVGSVATAFARLGVSAAMTCDAAEIAAADRLVLPGVGSAGFAMSRIGELGLGEAIRGFTRPILGICLGMQLMFDSSEEGEVDCLGLIPGRVSRLAPGPGRRVPHMGWSKLGVERPDLGLDDGDYLWFAHSYACEDGPATFARAEIGGPIPAAVAKDNLLGCQFHPERSGEAGARFLKKFLQS